jgi:hypothetical protein
MSADPHRLRDVLGCSFTERVTVEYLCFHDGICRNHRLVGNVGAFGRHCSRRGRAFCRPDYHLRNANSLTRLKAAHRYAFHQFGERFAL